MLQPQLLNRLQALSERYDEITAMLGDPEVIADQTRFRQLSREHARLSDLVSTLGQYRQNEADLAEARTLLAGDDADMAAMAREEIPALEARLSELADQLQVHLLPHDPADEGDVFLEIRAGTGGDEAALFAGDLMRMYIRYAERQGWRVSILSEQPGEHGGYREVIARVSGEAVYAWLKFESGVHRVQRVPETETQGRIHTSAATVAVMPVPEESEAVVLDPSSLKVDTFRASGAGGQHVNKTDSAIRITHLPSGIVVECQEERSQHKNRAKAMGLLAAKLADVERSRQQQEQAATRKALVGSGDRSERIRTYNFPQGRVTDHRINLTLYQLDKVLAGELDLVLGPLRQTDQTEQLMALAQEDGVGG